VSLCNCFPAENFWLAGVVCQMSACDCLWLWRPVRGNALSWSIQTVQVSSGGCVGLPACLAEARVPWHWPVKIFASVSAAIAFCKKSLCRKTLEPMGVRTSPNSDIMWNFGWVLEKVSLHPGLSCDLQALGSCSHQTSMISVTGTRPRVECGDGVLTPRQCLWAPGVLLGWKTHQMTLWAGGFCVRCAPGVRAESGWGPGGGRVLGAWLLWAVSELLLASVLGWVWARKLERRHLSARQTQRRAGCCAAGTSKVSAGLSPPAECGWKPLCPGTS